ncbi:MAG: pitrilysin family protein [Clostridia bacterium]|nr:pitrilysin family protein [Clostridia bacterium]
MFNQTTLPNGLRLIGEKIPHFRSVSIGMWFGAGSQYETPEQSGISHFIEHMLFKGTKKRTARQIAEVMDAVGGNLNAFTSKECTCFYAKVTDAWLKLAMDVLSDLTLNSVFDEAEIEKEKGVVIEEILMADDSPEDVASELIMLARYGDQPIARPILGSVESVKSFSREDILDYYKWLYRPDNCVVAICGNFDWDQVVEMAGEFFAGWNPPDKALPTYETKPAEVTELRREKDIEQMHLCLSFPGVAQSTDDLYPLSIINAVFGGSMSSRLFQSIREQRGLVYTVYSYPSSFSDTGCLVIYAGTSEQKLAEVMKELRVEISKMAGECMTKDEFNQAKEQLKGSFILGLESTSSRMNSMGRRLLLQNETLSEEQVIEKIDAVTYEQVLSLSKTIFEAPFAVALVGRGMDKVQL